MSGGGKPASPATPLQGPEIEALFKDWTAWRHIALAVSGGADSMALMILASEWRARFADPPRLTILTVDHGLRAESAEEAAWVKLQAARLGLRHATLCWTGAKPASDLQAAARTARYDLMLAFCREAGAEALATAHTADDQAETLLMRLARGSGLDGLAGMAPVSMRDGLDQPAFNRHRLNAEKLIVFNSLEQLSASDGTRVALALLRPLLGVTRARLEASLQARGEDWIEDPSNRDSRYERVRIREAMRAVRTLGLTPEHLALSARRLNAARHALDRVTRDFLDRELAIHPAGYGELPLAPLRDAPGEIGIRAIARMMEIFGGGQRPVRLARIEALHDAVTGGENRAATLGGCVFTLRRGHLRAVREYGRIDPVRIPLSAEGHIVWDGRFSIKAETQQGIAAGPLGPTGLALMRAMGGRIALPARIAHSLPALWRGESLVFAPFAIFTGEVPDLWMAGARVEFVGAAHADGHSGKETKPGLGN
jgi:tRNA(Ile)-lysidine synthase